MRVTGRLHAYKKGISAEESRRRRQDTILKIRKERKESRWAKRRQNATPKAPNVDGIARGDNETPCITIEDAPALLCRMNDPEIPLRELVESMSGILQILSSETEVIHGREILDAGGARTFVQLLDRQDCSEVQYQAAWALTNLASTKYTSEVVAAGVIPPMVKLLVVDESRIREQAAWCLGNIAGDCTQFRDLVLHTDALNGLLRNFEYPSSNILLCNVVWAVSNMCRGKPSPSFHYVRQVLPFLAGVIECYSTFSRSVVVDSLWALSYASDGDNDRVQAVVETSVVPHIVQILKEGISELSAPALRVAANIVTGTEIQTQLVLDAGVLDVCPELLRSKKWEIRKDTCWLLSNIAAGTPEQITRLTNCKMLGIVLRFAEETGWEVRKEAIWTVANIVLCGLEVHVMGIVAMRGIEVMVGALRDSAEETMILTALEALERMFTVGNKFNEDYRIILDECDGIEKVEDLQQHRSEKVYNMAAEFIGKHFNTSVNENLAPTDAVDVDFDMCKNLEFEFRATGPPLADHGTNAQT